MHPVATAGVVTNPHFVGGIADALRGLGAHRISIVEGGHADAGNMPHFEDRGYLPIAERLDLGLLSANLANLAEDGVHWLEVEGVILRCLPVVRPVGDTAARLINLPTMKTHNLAIVSLAIKNLQGALQVGYKAFCKEIDHPECHADLAATFHRDYEDVIRRGVERHRRAGLFGWDDDAHSARLERYCQRALDTLTAVRPWLNIVEGIVGRDGTGFHNGQDHLCNVVVAGRNAVHVDTVCAYLMGHDPRRIPLLRMADERGLGECDPAGIPIFILRDGEVEPIGHTALPRTPLGVHYLGDAARRVFL
jgi:uncharacterized protein (DUF362 family)